MNLSTTARAAIDFYGGVEFWQNARQIEALVSVTGWAFTLKRRPFFTHAKICMDVHRPYSILNPIGHADGITGILDGADVFLQDENNNRIADRMDARQYFSQFRRLFYWDDMDMAYFANYAFWNYFTLPNLLLNDTIQWTELETGILQAEFPQSIPTHSRYQTFHFARTTGQLLQHDYTADIISKWARAAHVIEQHQSDDIAFPSRRRITPRLINGKAASGPLLIDITVHEFRVSP